MQKIRYVKDKAKSDKWNGKILAKALAKTNSDIVIMSIKSCRNYIIFEYKERIEDA